MSTDLPRPALFELPPALTVRDALGRVLRLLSVGSKRFLTNKVDRSVTGLVARQQCAGPLQLTVSDVAVIAQSHLAVTGAATSVGEQPILGLLDPAAMARMTVGEALTNLVWAKISALDDVKCSANWMWAAKLPGEAAALTDAAQALRDVMIPLRIAIDGGKDSLSMAALAPRPDGPDETVKAPGSLVISTYVTCPDVRKVVTPDFKRPGSSELLFIDLGGGRDRLGGSALAQVFGRIGDTPPDLEDTDLFKRVFHTVQMLIERDVILAGHDRSDGGLITTLLEMAFAGNCGLDVDVASTSDDPVATLFNEELGLVMEVPSETVGDVETVLTEASIPFSRIGKTSRDRHVLVKVEGRKVIDEAMPQLRDLWEETSYRLDLLQANPECVEQERDGLKERTAPAFRLSFRPGLTPDSRSAERHRFKVAVLREEGSNGDREMASAFYLAGFETWDITMTDLVRGQVNLDEFRGLVFPGGFSYADVLDSAKGWAGVIRFNTRIWKQIQRFYHRSETFSLGVCNGCQLMALIGWVPWLEIPDTRRPRFIHNRSGRFESRFATVSIEPTPAIMLEGMAGSVLGIWVAHGEGQAYFPDRAILEEVEREHLVPLRFVDDGGQPTETYPFNPNGSPLGIAGLCSRDGRHLVMMPHPERAFLKWQWGWMPEPWKKELKASPWLQMFQNARIWCEQNET